MSQTTPAPASPATRSRATGSGGSHPRALTWSPSRASRRTSAQPVPQAGAYPGFRLGRCSSVRATGISSWQCPRVPRPGTPGRSRWPAGPPDTVRMITTAQLPPRPRTP